MEEQDPFSLFATWFREAQLSEPGLPEAATLATVDLDLRPSARMMLVKRWSPSGFEFFTDLRSRKARQLGENPQAALTFHWKSLARSIRVEGAVERLSELESTAYWSTRPRGSQISATVSRQSSPIGSRAELEGLVSSRATELGDREVPRPPTWGGFRLVPGRIEFWREQPDRLHERLVFTRGEAGGGWSVQVLQP